MAWELERHGLNPWALSPHQIVMRVMSLREDQHQAMLRATVASSVPHYDKKAHKKFWDDNQ